MKEALPRTVWVLGIASLLNDVSTEMIHSVLPIFLVSNLGASMLFVGLLEGLAESLASILRIGSGALSDFLGHRKWLLVSGYALSTLVKPLYVFASNANMVLLARLSDRVGKGIRVAPRDALVADSTPEPLRGAAYGLRQSLDTIGALCGPLIAFLVLSSGHCDFRCIFTVALIPAFLTVALLCVGIQESASASAQGKLKATPAEVLKLPGAFWLLAAVTFLFNLGNSSDAFILLKANSAGVETAFVPLSLVAMNLFYALSAYPAGALSDKLGRKGLLLLGYALYALVYVGFACANQPFQIWLLLAVYGLQLGLTQGILPAMVSDIVPANLRGTAFGIVHLATGAALLPASLMAGYLWMAVAPAYAFLAGATCSLIAALLLCSVKVRSHNGSSDLTKS